MSQAQRCTILEAHALNYWRSRGVMIKASEPIPLSEEPAPFAQRRPVLYALGCASISIAATLMGCMWLAVGAGLWK